MKRSVLVASLLCLLSTPALAIIYGGNPHLDVKVAVPDVAGADAVVIDEIKVLGCSGPDDGDIVDEWLDPGEDWAAQIDPNDYCGVIIKWEAQ